MTVTIKMIDVTAKLPVLDFWIIVRLKDNRWGVGFNRYQTEHEAIEVVRKFQDGDPDWRHVRLVNIKEPTE